MTETSFSGTSLKIACASRSRPSDDGAFGHACTLVGCESGARLELAAVPASELARLTGARIEVCFAGTCKQGVIDTLPTANDVKSLNLGSPGESRIEVMLARTDPSGVLEIELVIASEDHERFHEGDVYTIRLTAADGSHLVDRAWSVSYRTWQPNGSDCEPTCRYAETITEL